MLPTSSPTRLANDPSIQRLQKPAKGNVRVHIHTPVKDKKWKGISLTRCCKLHWMKTPSSTPLPKSRHTSTSSINAFLRKHGGHFDVTMLLQKCANVQLDIDIFQDLISRILHVTNPNDRVDVLMAHCSNFPFPELESFLDGMTVKCMNELIPTLAPPVTPSPQTPNTPANPSCKISVIPFELPSDEDGKEEDSPQKGASEKKSISTEKSPKRPCLEKDRAPAMSAAQRKSVTPENSKKKTPKMLEVPRLGEANDTDDE